MSAALHPAELPASLDRKRGVARVWCAHCRRHHQHGAAGIEDGTNPHRLAHCHRPGSPYAAAGYVLRVEGGGNGRA